MTSLRERLREVGNDYSALEARYREATGGELVLDPYDSPAHGPAALSASVSVLIGAHDSLASLVPALLALEGSSFNRKHPSRLEVIVVDDGSADGTREALLGLDLALRWRYVRRSNGGLGAAHNTALAFAQGDLIILSDADVVHMPYVVEELVKRYEVIGDALLLGFRFDVAGDDPRLAADRLPGALAGLWPRFYEDFRLRFPGRPRNICRETRHLKDLGEGRALRMSNGAAYNLPAMAVGALMAFSRSDYLAIGGSDERLIGWGCEDSLIGARLLALGRAIVPVYAAAGWHVAHERRGAAEPAEFARNLATCERILDEDHADLPRADLDRWREPVEEVVDRLDAPSPPPPEPFDGDREAPLERALADEALGQWQRALAHYRQAPDSPLSRLGRARCLRELTGDTRALADYVEQAPDDGAARLELALAHARRGDFARGRAELDAGVAAPDGVEAAWASRLSAGVHKARGNEHAGQGLHAIATTDFELSLLLDPDAPWTHFDLGVSRLALGLAHEATAALRRADALLHPEDGNRSWVHLGLARAATATGEWSSAKLELERAMRRAPDELAAAQVQAELAAAAERRHGIACPAEVVSRALDIDGWLTTAEADLLVALVLAAPRAADVAVVEVGSFRGRSTAVLAAAVRTWRPDAAPVVAIDPHEGYAEAGGADTYAALVSELSALGLLDAVEVVRARAAELPWTRPVALLFIDALHDYDSVREDFECFDASVIGGGIVAFHDYAPWFPGVERIVEELLRGDRYAFAAQRDGLVALRAAG